MLTATVQVRPASETDIDPLLAFTASYYGPGSNQASRTRIEWLFRHNPNSQGISQGLLVAAVDGQVVGSHWKMCLPWRIAGERVMVASPHDLALLPLYRTAAQGARSAVPPGLQLALGALNREKYVALLGLSPTSEAIYSRFQCQPVPMVRMRKIISPARTAIGIAAQACGLTPKMPHDGETNIEWTRAGRRILLQRHPSDPQLSSALSLNYRGDCHPDWDLPSYRWRFFHPLGPGHFLLTFHEDNSVVARAVFSLGLRRGVRMARIVDAAVLHQGLYPALLQAVQQAMRHVHVAVATVATTCEPACLVFQRLGWRPQQGVVSRFFIRPPHPLDFRDLWGGAYDYGFDALSTG